MLLSAEFKGLDNTVVNSHYAEMFWRPAAQWMVSALWFLGLIKLIAISANFFPLWLMVIISIWLIAVWEAMCSKSLMSGRVKKYLYFQSLSDIAVEWDLDVQIK